MKMKNLLNWKLMKWMKYLENLLKLLLRILLKVHSVLLNRFFNFCKVLSKAEGVTLLTTTTVNVMRYIGKYLHMMKVLEPISFEVYTGITQTFEYYVSFFFFFLF